LTTTSCCCHCREAEACEMGEGGRPEAMATTNKWRVWRESNGQRYNQPIEGGGGDGRCWTLSGRWWTAYIGQGQTANSYATLAAWDMGVVCPPLATVHLVGCLNPQCQSLVRYGMQVLLLCQFEVGVCLELAGLIDLRAPGIIHHRSSCTYSVRDLCRH
jgi:hypothetical protein